MTSFIDIMKSILFTKGRGKLFTPNLFGDKVAPASLRTELVNLSNSGFIIHVARGLYYFPHIGEDGKRIQPSLFEILEYVEQSSKVVLYPTHESALYLIGDAKNTISPMEFYTTGVAKIMKLNSGTELSFIKKPKGLELPMFSNLKTRTLFMACSFPNGTKKSAKLVSSINKFYGQLKFDGNATEQEFLSMYLQNTLGL